MKGQPAATELRGSPSRRRSCSNGDKASPSERTASACLRGECGGGGILDRSHRQPPLELRSQGAAQFHAKHLRPFGQGVSQNVSNGVPARAPRSPARSRRTRTSRNPTQANPPIRHPASTAIPAIRISGVAAATWGESPVPFVAFRSSVPMHKFPSSRRTEWHSVLDGLANRPTWRVIRRQEKLAGAKAPASSLGGPTDACQRTWIAASNSRAIRWSSSSS